MIAPERIERMVEKAREEERRELEALRARPDKLPEYDYFLNALAGGGPAQNPQRRGFCNVLCVQAPLELIHAAGFLPSKLCAGSLPAATLAAAGLPALMCPMLRSLAGLLLADRAAGVWLLPTTCDWIVKFPELLALKGCKPRVHCLELPHLKETARGEALWEEEVFRLKAFLEAESGRKITRAALRDSILIYNRAAYALAQLQAHRRAGLVPFVWFLAVTAAFFLDTPERWTAAVDALVKALPQAPRNPQGWPPGMAAGDPAGQFTNGKLPKQNPQGRGFCDIFLAGSPLFFPAWKLARLLEEAGLYVAADDLCSASRIFPGNTSLTDESLQGMTAALAERYHHGCLCPTFAQNDRRVNNIFAQTRAGARPVVVYHVLKGCHPCDIESYSLEAALKARGARFLRLETDYTPEDSGNLLTRLEAFKEALKTDVENWH